VMLVLLVMLIITIPVQLHSVNLDLPSAQTQQEPEIIRLQIDAQGFVRWNEELITEVAALHTRLAQAAQLPRQPEIHVTPTPDTPYALVAGMLAIAQRAGLRQVGVVN
jgi:biopolymer transport protein ExbD